MTNPQNIVASVAGDSSDNPMIGYLLTVIWSDRARCCMNCEQTIPAGSRFCSRKSRQNNIFSSAFRSIWLVALVVSQIVSRLQTGENAF
jgi:hypothetical protein